MSMGSVADGGIRRAAAACLWAALLCFYPGALPVKGSDVVVADKTKVSKRPPWTSSRITGRPEPAPPFQTVRVFPGVQFTNPLLFAAMPDADVAFVAEQSGKIFSFPLQPNAKKRLAIDLAKEIQTVKQTPHAKEVEACYGLAFHPKFASNRKCYICYTLRDERPGKQLENGTRVSEFVVSAADPPRIEPASEKLLLSYLQGGHNAGDLHFGPDGCLYISTGDAADPNPPDRLRTGQGCDDLLSSILRINVDHPDPGKSYGVPKDNPFVSHKNVRPEIWAFGFRNPWRMSFDRTTGDLWTGDVGWEMWEMIHRVRRGGNYGWPIVEGRQSVLPNEKPGPAPILPPAIELPHSIAASVTGGYVYRGRSFPELSGRYIFGDWETRRIWAADFDRERVLSYKEIAEPAVRIVAFGQDRSGEHYLLDYDAGTVHTFARNEKTTANTNFPKRLSETGLFADGAGGGLARGVSSFSVNAEQWQDGATAERFIALPGSSRVVWSPRDVSVPGSMFQRQLEFPTDGVLGRTVSIETTPGDPGSKRKIETQILHYDGKTWRGYTYLWNHEQTDGVLAPADGAVHPIKVNAGPHSAESKTISWQVFGRQQCIQCHNAWAQHSLAFNIAQLHRDIQGKSQLAGLVEHGVLERRSDANVNAGPPDASALAALQHLVSPTDQSATVDQRARSYLHANCAHCHRFGGGGSVDLQLPFTAAMGETKTVDVRPHQGGLGLNDARIIAPGDPDRSVLYYRMVKFGSGRMPHLGSEQVDEAGVELIRKWIEQMDPNRQAIAKLDDLASANQMARRIARGELSKEARTAVLTAAASKAPHIRDLFEGFQPIERRRRTVGSSPNAQMIAELLQKQGDTGRGRDLFWNREVLQCRNCHQINGSGSAVGPELTTIGKLRGKSELLDSLLRPSAKIETAHAAYVLQLESGETLTGLLLRRDAKEVVVRDAKGVERKLPAKEVEKIVISQTSLMPESLIRDVTPEEAADLLAYLSSLK